MKNSSWAKEVIRNHKGECARCGVTGIEVKDFKFGEVEVSTSTGIMRVTLRDLGAVVDFTEMVNGVCYDCCLEAGVCPHCGSDPCIDSSVEGFHSQNPSAGAIKGGK